MTTPQQYQFLEQIKRECGLVSVPPEIDPSAPPKRIFRRYFGNPPPRKPHHEMLKAKYPPKPGEVLLKEWVSGESGRLKIGYGGVMMRIHRGDYPLLSLRRVNARVIFVKSLDPTLNGLEGGGR